MTSIVVLAHLLLVQLLITSAREDFVPNVTVSTLEGVSFTGVINDMKPHPSDPNSLLLIDQNALLSLNVLTKQTSTVAGVASSYGYVEGVGEAARFDYPYSFIIINKTRIIVSDTGNHCIRDVDLSTGQTSPLAGTCQSQGFTDGTALQARFSHPQGLLQYKTGVLVADNGNDAVRWLDAGRVSTLVRGYLVWFPFYFTERDGVVYMSTPSGVVKLDPDTAAVQLIAGRESSEGFSDGPLLSARFSYIFGLVSLSPDVVLLADRSNARLRLLNLPDNTVRSICTGTRRQGDGAADRCQLLAPSSITVLNETIYVGEFERIRTIPLQSIIRKDPPEVEFVIKFCPPSVNLTIPAGQTAVSHAWPQPEVEGGTARCIMCPEGNSQLFPPGETLISYIYPSNVAGSKRVECNFTVSVKDVCPLAEVNVLLKPGERLASVDISSRMLTLPRGEFQIASTLSDGTKCTTSINITSVEKQPVIKNCPGNVTLSLPAGQKSVNYSWTEPAVEGENLSCILCPPRPSGTFGVGITRIVYYYRSDTGMDSTCLFYITVREQVATEHCPPSLIEKSLEPGQNKTTVETPGGELVLSAGETPLRTRLSNGTECLTTIVVKEEFEVTCPKSITAQLQKGTNMTEVSWLMPQIKGVNHSDVECDSCPANSAEFGVGVHTVEYKYIYTPNKFSMSCSFVVLVVGADNDKPRCSPVVLGLKKGERTAGFVIQTNQKNISIRLAVGVHELEMPNQSGETCLTTFTVHDTSPAGWSVVLQASYPAECEKLNDISYVVIRALLQHHFANLAKLCPECQLVGDQPYEMNCQAGVLVVQWTTGISIDTESGGIPATVTSSLLKDLKSIQDSSLSYGRFFDITVIAGTPLIVSPIRNNDGLYLRLRVVASCPLPQMVYDNADDACYIP